MSSIYDYFTDDRECESCPQSVHVEGTLSAAYGQCEFCGEPMWVYRWEELGSINDEQAMDAARDAR